MLNVFFMIINLKYLKELLNKKIDTMIHYPYMLNELKFFPNAKLKNCKRLGDQILSLPISEEHTAKEIEYVSNKIIDFFNKKK